MKRRTVLLTVSGTTAAAIALVGAVAGAGGLGDMAGLAAAETPVAVAPAVAAALPVAEPYAEVDADPVKVQAALAGAITDAALGSSISVRVIDDDGDDMFSAGGAAAIPASTTKLLSGFAALMTLGPDHVFTTRVLVDGDRIVLVGGGDPLFSRAQLATLAQETAAALAGAGGSGYTIGYDTSLFEGPSTAPSWKPSYVSSRVVSPISALWLDDGRRNADGQVISKVPAPQVAAAFAKLLSQEGIKVTGTPAAVIAPDGATPVATADSAGLAQILRRTIEVSDNDAAEVLARQAAIARDLPASFDGGTAAVTAVLAEAGIGVEGLRLADGSGLSRDNLIPAQTLVDLLRYADTEPQARALLQSLPVAGFSGTVGQRFGEAKAGLGVVRAKTGSLNSVRSLAGTVTTADGAVLYFAALADGIAPGYELSAEAALDRLIARLAACACR